jgi:PAS domain S-box-containing protein
MEDAIFVFDESNSIIDFNAAAEAIIGSEVSENNTEQTELIFKKFPSFKSILKNMRHSEVPIHVDGQKRIYDIRVSNLLDYNGNTIGRIMALRDITARKRAIETILESEEKFKFLAENMADIVWTLDMDFNADYVSPSIEKVLGFTPEERKQQKFEEMITPESLERIMAVLSEEIQRDDTEDSNPDRSIILDVEYYHKNGSTVWMENIVKAIRDQTGSAVGMYGSSRNITDRKKAEADLLLEKGKLQEAILEIKKLSGMLPICSHCKNIRDDKGYWNQIENYIEKHSEAEFSHGLCPKCIDEIYGEEEWYKKGAK